MKRNRHWITGAIATVIALLVSYALPFLGMLPALGTQAMQSSPGQRITRSVPSPPFRAPVVADNSSNFLEQGRRSFQAGRYATAAQQFRQSLEIASKLDSPLEQAQSWSFLSLAQQQLGDWTAAELSVSKSLDLASRVAASREQFIILGRALNTQGSLYFSKGQAEAALESWKAAETAYGEAKDETRQLGSLMNQSQALQSLGFYSRARRILEAVRQRLDNQPLALQLTGLRNLGNMYWLVGDLEASREALQQAIDLAKRLNQPPQLAAALLSLGNTERSQEKLDSSLQHYEQAAQWGVGEIKFQATLNQFQLLLHREELVQARRLLPSLESQQKRLPPNRSVLYGSTQFANGLTQLAFLPQSTDLSQRKSFSSPGKKQVALRKIQDKEVLRLATETLDWVIASAQEIGDARAETYGRGYLGNLYERSGQWGKAQALTEAALTQAERINADDIGYQWQWQLGRILKAQEQTAASKIAYQAAYETLQSLRSDLVAAQSDVQFSFRESIEPVYREFVDLLLRPGVNGAEPTPETLSLARQVIESLQVAELNNFFRTACIQDQVVSLEEIDREGTAVIYPIILPDRITIILSLPGQSLHSYTEHISQAKVEQTLEALRFYLEIPYAEPKGKQLGEEVYQWLIAPIRADLDQQNIKSLAFVLDGALRNVPMAGLYDGEQYLVENFSIALTPGLQLLAPKPLSIKRERTLIAGLSEARPRFGFGALPYVEDELAAVEQAVSIRRLFNKTFTRAALEEDVKSSDFSVVHLATHGQFSSKVEETFILAWDEPVNVTALSSALRRRDRPEPIELLVLSACNTADGDNRATLGLAGLSVQAGARSTLASLWSLNDESGAQFVKQFYHALSQEGVSRAEALQRAQIALLKQPKYENPIFWASYVLVGNWL